MIKVFFRTEFGCYAKQLRTVYKQQCRQNQKTKMEKMKVERALELEQNVDGSPELFEVNFSLGVVLAVGMKPALSYIRRGYWWGGRICTL